MAEPGARVLAASLIALLWLGVLGCGEETRTLESRNVAEVCAILSLGEPEERREAARNLADRGDPKAIPALLDALSDQDFKVRTAAVKALTRLGASSAVAPLGEILVSRKDPLLAYDAVDALAKIGGEPAILALLRAEASGDEDVSERIRTEVMPEILRPSYAEFLDKLLEQGPEEVRPLVRRYLEFLVEKYPVELEDRVSGGAGAGDGPSPTPATGSPEKPPEATPTRKPRPTTEPTRKPTRRPTRRPRPTARPTRRPRPTAAPTRRPRPTRPPEPAATRPPATRRVPDPPTEVSTPTPRPTRAPPPTSAPTQVASPPTPPPQAPRMPDGSQAYRPRRPPRKGDRSQSQLLFREAWKQEQAGQLEAAVFSYREAVKKDPSFADPAYNLGVLLDRMKRWDEARQAYQLCLAADPRQAEVRANLGRVLLQQGYSEQAAQELVLAVRSPDARSQWTTLLGRALVETGRTAMALQVLRQATLKRDPEGAFELGRLLEGRRLYLEAAEAYGIAGSLGSSGPEAYYNQGTMYMNAERFDLAERAYRQALAADPTHSSTHYNLAVLLIKTRRYAEARIQIERVRASGRDTSQLEAALPAP